MVNGKDMKEGKWLSTQAVYQQIKSNTDTSTFPNVPNGKKINKLFLENNEISSSRIKGGRRSIFFDNCRVWDSIEAESAKTAHNVSQNLWQVTKRGDMYCMYLTPTSR